MEVVIFPLSKLELDPGLDDLFWKEKVSRAIKDENSVVALRKYCDLLLTLCTQRQGVIKGLAKELLTTKNLKVPDSEFVNPNLESEI